MKAELSRRTIEHIAAVFQPEDRERVAQLLMEQCGTNLPGLQDLDAVGLERCRFAALKISDGELGKLERAIRLAQTDWRDLLVAAGFAEDLRAHEEWTPSANPS